MVDGKRANADRRRRTRREALTGGLRLTVGAVLLFVLFAVAGRTVEAGVNAKLAGGSLPVPALGLLVGWVAGVVGVLGLVLTSVTVLKGRRGAAAFSVEHRVGAGAGVRRWPGPEPVEGGNP